MVITEIKQVYKRHSSKFSLEVKSQKISLIDKIDENELYVDCNRFRCFLTDDNGERRVEVIAGKDKLDVHKKDSERAIQILKYYVNKYTEKRSEVLLPD